MNDQADTTNPSGYDAIGTLLRLTREEIRMPIDQAARVLHIRVRYLEALELGNLSELPGLTYTRGYLQAYAIFLGLDKEEILRRFESVESNLGGKNFYFPQVFSKQKSPSHWLVWGGLFTAFSIYMAWFFGLQTQMVRISMVEKPPIPQVELIKVTAEMAEDVPCLRSQNLLYPPCIKTPEFSYNLTPLHSQLNTLMDLAK